MFICCHGDLELASKHTHLHVLVAVVTVRACASLSVRMVCRINCGRFDPICRLKYELDIMITLQLF